MSSNPMESYHTSQVAQFETLLRESISSEELIEFREYLHDHFNYENLTFWLEVESFKTLTNKDIISRKALEIYVKYFGRGSDYELNINDSARTRLKERLQDPDTNIFDEVQRSIIKLMAEDIYPKFKMSDRYKKLKTEETVGNVDDRKPRQTKSYTDFRTFLEQRELHHTSRHVNPKAASEPLPMSPQSEKKKKLLFTAWTDIHVSLRGSKTKRTSPSPPHDDLVNYRSMSVSHTGTSEDLSLKMLAGDIVLNTRVKSYMTCGQFLRLQLKKLPHEDTKRYGIYLLKAKKWLSAEYPLYIYRADLQNPKEVITIQELPADISPTPEQTDTVHPMEEPKGVTDPVPTVLGSAPIIVDFEPIAADSRVDSPPTLLDPEPTVVDPPPTVLGSAPIIVGPEPMVVDPPPTVFDQPPSNTLQVRQEITEEKI